MTVEYYYMKHMKLWSIEVYDENHEIVCPPQEAKQLEEALRIANQLAAKYGAARVKHIRPTGNK